MLYMVPRLQSGQMYTHPQDQCMGDEPFVEHTLPFSKALNLLT